MTHQYMEIKIKELEDRVKALEQEPDGRMTREEAIRELSYIADEMPSMECRNWKEAIDMAIKALKQEQKTGYWILLDECSNSGYYCSECHKKVVKEGWSETVKKIKFCPNCGIKMLPQPYKGESEG